MLLKIGIWGKKKKKGLIMPHIARKQYNSKFQHVIVQGINREYIFEEEENKKKYKELIYNKLYDTGITILAYCIMSNHAHLLIHTEKIEGLSKFMQKLNTAYAMYYNKTKDRVGFVFKNRYFSREILNQGQLYTCLRYIHNNPVKANICKEMKSYPYSSYNDFFNRNNKLITNKSLKLLFGRVISIEEIFNSIHQKQSIYDLTEKEDINEFMKKVICKYNIKVNKIKKDKALLEIVIKEIKEKTDASVKEIAEILDISKTTAYKYLKF